MHNLPVKLFFANHSLVNYKTFLVDIKNFLIIIEIRIIINKITTSIENSNIYILVYSYIQILISKGPIITLTPDF